MLYIILANITTAINKQIIVITVLNAANNNIKIKNNIVDTKRHTKHSMKNIIFLSYHKLLSFSAASFKKAQIIKPKFTIIYIPAIIPNTFNIEIIVLIFITTSIYFTSYI